MVARYHRRPASCQRTQGATDVGMLDGLLSPLVTQTANARGAYLSGEREAKAKGVSDAIAQLKAKREADSAQIEDELHKAQTKKALQVPVATTPKPPATKSPLFQKDDKGNIYKVELDGRLVPYEPNPNGDGTLIPKMTTAPAPTGGLKVITPNAPPDAVVDLAQAPTPGMPAPAKKPEMPKFGQKLVTGTTPSGDRIRVQDAEGADLPEATTGSGSAAMKMKVAENRTTASNIDKAIAAATAYPDAFGLARGLPVIGDRLDARADPQGIAARSLVANIGSLKIHDRSGAAVSVHEFPRLAPFIPNIYDPIDKILTNLRQMKAEIAKMNMEIESVSGAPAPHSTKTPDHSHMSDAEFAAAWKAGKFGTP